MTPSLYLLSRPHFTNEYQAFLAKTGVIWQETKVSDAERVVEFAGRICYMSFGARQSPRDNAAYIANLIDQGHDSVLEHASWTFLLDGVSRSLTHQLIRHKIGFSYSQLSQQYYDHSAAEFLMPTGLEQIRSPLLRGVLLLRPLVMPITRYNHSLGPRAVKAATAGSGVAQFDLPHAVCCQTQQEQRLS